MEEEFDEGKLKFYEKKKTEEMDEKQKKKKEWEWGEMLKYFEKYYEMLKKKEKGKELDEMNEKKKKEDIYEMQKKEEKEEGEAALPHLLGGVRQGLEAALDDDDMRAYEESWWGLGEGAKSISVERALKRDEFKLLCDAELSELREICAREVAAFDEWISQGAMRATNEQLEGSPQAR
jgi:hypothetical protein